MLNRKLQQHNINQEQILASDPSACVYVAASAGTGKTKVLTDRFLRLLLIGTPVHKILCLTFTNAAAAEMLERIVSKLRQWNELSNVELASELENLTGVIADSNAISIAKNLFKNYLEFHSKVQIQTIHSLCQKILNYTPHSMLQSKLLSTYQANQLYNKAYKAALKEPALKSAFQKLLNKYENGYVKSTLVRDFIHNKVEATAFFKSPKDTYQIYGTDKNFDEAAYQEQFTQEALSKLSRILGETGINTFEEYQKHFLTMSGTVRKDIEKMYSQHPELENLALELLAAINKINTKKAADLNSALIMIASYVHNEFERLKTENMSYDYSDLLILTYNLLKESESADNVLYGIDCSIEHVLVDEAQDLSKLQWNIVRCITDEFFAGIGASEANRTLFIVGDYKQSIYSFQGSDPEIFLNAKNYFSKKALDAQKIWREIDMQVSYRSTQPILDCVNNVSKRIFGNKNIHHTSFKTGDGIVKLWETIKRDKNTKNNDWDIPTLEDKTDSLEYELATDIAEKIKDMLASNHVIPSDIMILLKRRGELMRYIISSLKKHGIPVSDADRLNLSEELIVQDLISLAKFILLPIDDFNLACLLKSPFFGISEELLQTLCLKRGDSSLFSVLEDEVEIYNELLSLTERYQEDIYKFYIHVLEGRGYKQKFIERFGRKAVSIIHQFYNLVIEYSQDSEANLQNFVSYIEDNSIEVNNQSDPTENQVRVMTVHGSKGLQAPIVILADSTNNLDSRRDTIIWQNNFPFVSLSLDCEISNKVKEYNKEMDHKENMRLLYVAMTRAEKELYFTGVVPSHSFDKSWYSIVESYK